MAPTPASIRIPEPLRCQIRAKAEAERRSFSSQCIVLLETALAAPALTDRERAFVDELRDRLDAHEVAA